MFMTNSARDVPLLAATPEASHAPCAGSCIHRRQRRSTTLLRLAGVEGIMCASFPGSAGVAGRLRSLGRPVARRQGAAVPGGAWAGGARGRCQMSMYVLDQGRRKPGGGAGRVMRICPSGPAGTAVTGNATSCDIDAVAGLALIPAGHLFRPERTSSWA